MHRSTLAFASVAIVALLASPSLAALTAVESTPAAPASSAPAPVCDATYDATVAALRASDHVVTEVPPDGMAETIAEILILTGQNHSAATRAFGVVLNGEPVFGIEEGGCLLPPIHFAKRVSA
jgi:hypothetical protein